MTGKFAEVYVNIETSGICSSFDYSIPENLAQEIQIGSVVIVPFGSRYETGFVSKLKTSSGYISKKGSQVKEISSLIIKEPLFDKNRLKLARWLSYYYFSSTGNALKLFMPPGYKLKIKKFILPGDNMKKEYPYLIPSSAGEAIEEKEAITLLERNENIPEIAAKKIINNLEKSDNSKVFFNLEKSKISLKYVNFYFLKDPDGKTDELFQETDDKSEASKKRLTVVMFLRTAGSASKDIIIKNTGASEYTINSLLKKQIVLKEKRSVKRDFNYDSYLMSGEELKQKVLTQNQKLCIKEISQLIGKETNHNFLLQGVTGSGKTEVYIQCAANALKIKKTVLVLTPEISLTPQLYKRFNEHFKENVTVYHSAMSDNERFEKWSEINEGSAKIVIGTRSAIFTPFKNLGLIIADEEHDPSYKENYGLRYNGVRAALRLGKILKIPVVLGSATPSVEDKYIFHNSNNHTVLKMPEKIFQESNVEKIIVDLKKIDKFREDEIITDKLQSALREVSLNKNKAIIFINRRGYSNFVICSQCGHIPKCENCSLSYTFHLKDKKLKCHHCGTEENFDFVCPSCKSKRVTLYGTGIQKVESKLKLKFPEMEIIRMDSDTTSAKKSHQDLLEKFINKSPSILIGTQMIAKGLDIPDVTLVGVINIDSALSLPDYHMNERVFQLFTQVSGRTGRSSKKGRVIIQTFNPESNIIKNYMDDDFEGFYLQELKNREELKYPPYTNLINFIISSKDENNAKTEITRFRSFLEEVYDKKSDFLLGPSPAPFAKINGYYRWHILVKSYKINRFISSFTKKAKNFKIKKDTRFISDTDPTWIL